MKRSAVMIVAVTILAITALAQYPPQKKGSAPASSTPTQELDEKEFELRWKAETKARRIPDPNKRIEALQKMLTDFPNDPPVLEVEQGILDTYIEFWPQQSRLILAQIDKLIGRTRANQKVGSGNNLFNQLAVKLVKAGLLLDRAEELALKALSLFDEEEFYKSQKRLFALRKEPVPGAEDFAKRFRADRAKILTTLGRIYLKKGKAAEAERIFKDAYESNKTISETNLALAEITLKSGDNVVALEYLSSAAVSDPLRPEWRQQLENLYRATHQGSLKGLDQMLDDTYRSLMPNPIRVEGYQPSPTRSDRIVLAELFTGSGCIPCVASDLSFEAVMNRYSSKEIAVLIYHLHVPQPDPMTNPAGISRAAFYGIIGTPRTVIDAEIYDEGGGPRDWAGGVYRHIEPMIEKRLEEPAQARIALNATLEGFAVKVDAVVDQVKTYSKSLRLQVALVENELQYAGENRVRIHPMVVRSLAGPAASKGFPIAGKEPTVVNYTFDLKKISAQLKAYLENYEINGKHGRIRFTEKKYAITRENLSVVAFVQDERDKRVLQAMSLRVQPISVPASAAQGNQ